MGRPLGPRARRPSGRKKMARPARCVAAARERLYARAHFSSSAPDGGWAARGRPRAAHYRARNGPVRPERAPICIRRPAVADAKGGADLIEVARRHQPPGRPDRNSKELILISFELARDHLATCPTGAANYCTRPTSRPVAIGPPGWGRGRADPTHARRRVACAQAAGPRAKFQEPTFEYDKLNRSALGCARPHGELAIAI